MKASEAQKQTPAVLRPFVIRYLAPAFFIAYLLVAIGLAAFVVKAGFASRLEVGYPDSYILYDVLHFEKTGVIYRDLSAPPYLPAQYSPFVYIVYSLSRYFSFTNIFLGPRLIAFAMYLLSLALVASLVKRIVPVRLAWLWGIAIAASIRVTDLWILQLRGDFIGIFFGLAAIRLLMSRYRYAALAAGLCAGMAIQVKLTLLGASAAGFLWLLLRRQWKDAAMFTLGALITTVGLFSLYWLREPRMIPEMMALMPGIKQPHGTFAYLFVALQEPVVLLSLPGLALFTYGGWMTFRRWPNLGLLVLYALAAAGFGCLANMQAGGNINYLFEFLFALVPLAVLGLFRLFAWSSRQNFAAFFVAGVFIFHFLILDANGFRWRIPSFSPATVNENNLEFMRLEDTLRGLRILSVDPRVALIDPNPALMEPYLLSYMRRLGRFDPSPLIQRIDRGDFDVFVSIGPFAYRGIGKFEGADLKEAVSRAYRPFCTILDDTIQLPQSRPPNPQLESRLRAAGCAVLNPTPQP